MLLLNNVYAESNGVNVIKVEADGVSSGSKVSISVDYPAGYTGGSSVYVLPVPEGTDIKSADISKAVYVGETSAASAKAQYTFLLKSGVPNGRYAIVTDGTVSSDDLGGRVRYFYYNSDISAVKAAVSGLKQSADYAGALSDGNNSYWYVDVSNPAWISSKSNISGIMKGMTLSTSGDVEEAFDIACTLVNASASDSSKFKAMLTYSNGFTGFDIANEDYVKYTDAAIEKFKTLLSEAKPSSVDEAKLRFREACALVCMSNTNRTHSIADLQKYNDVFKLDFTGKYVNADINDVAKVFEGKDYVTVKQVQDDFEMGVNKFYNNPSGGSSASPGGSRSNGGGLVISGSNVGSDIVSDIIKSNTVFDDVDSSNWAKDYIKFVYDNNIMIGDGTGLFRPEDYVSREEWAKIILCTFGVDTEGAECNFDDVSKEEWFYPYVSRAFELDIVNGISNSSFGTGQSLTRQDAVVMLYRLLLMARDNAEFKSSDTSFSDGGEIADYAKEAIEAFGSLGVVNGYSDGSFKPNGNITRAEAAKIIKVLLDKVD